MTWTRGWAKLTWAMFCLSFPLGLLYFIAGEWWYFWLNASSALLIWFGAHEDWKDRPPLRAA